MEVITPGYRRVTEVLHRYVSFDHIDAVKLAKAAERGTRVHGFCAAVAEELPLPFIDEDCKGYVESFQQWFESRVGVSLAIEKRYYCDTWRITGAIDIVLLLKGESKPTIVDLKTPATESKSWALQTAAYQYLYNKEIGKAGYGPAERRLVLMLKPDGRAPRVIEYSDPNHWDVYLGILKAERYFG